MRGLNVDIFSYGALKQKAQREIERLIQAETNLNKEAAVDNALNAAFTIYHLIQWRQAAQNPHIKIKVHEFIMGTANQGLKILHSVVTCNKHVTVTEPAYSGATNPQLEDSTEHITTEDGRRITTEGGTPLVTEESGIKVYFGNEKAITTLHDALSEFA